MIELITAYSAKEIIVFIVLLALSIKAVASFIKDTFKEIKGIVHTSDRLNKYDERLERLEEDMLDIKDSINLLRKSDICSFRNQLVKDYDYYKDRGWISAHSLAALEDQFEIYKEEGGNSFAEQIMTDIRALPKEPSG